MSKAFAADIHHFIAAHGLELVHFAKGQRKDDVTQRLLAGFTGPEGVLYAGRAQEKPNVWRTQRRHHADGSSYAWLVRASAFINFFYFYCVDADFGPFFLKFSTYFPFTAKLCINGNEWAKRQAAKAGIRQQRLDVSRAEPVAQRLQGGHITTALSTGSCSATTTTASSPSTTASSFCCWSSALSAVGVPAGGLHLVSRSRAETIDM